MAPFLLKVGSPILLVGGLIFVHELGHFLVAKLFRVKVLKFSIGFGPRLMGFQRGETEYQVAVIPLGGYVKMAGEDPAEQLAPEDAGRGFQEQPPWKRSMIALAGPAMNLIFPVAIYFCVFYFQTQGISTRVGNVDPDSAAGAADIRSGDRILAIDGEPVTYFHQVRDRIGPRFDQKVHLEIQRLDGSIFEAEVTPRKVVDKDFFHPEGEARGVLGIDARQPASVIGVIDPASPAGKAGLKSLDRLTRVAGQPVGTLVDVQKLLALQGGPFEVEYLRPEPLPTPGASLTTEAKHTATISPVHDAKGSWQTGISGAASVVAQVQPGSPAAEAGLRPGDWVQTANGTPLAAWSTLEHIRGLVHSDPIDLAILRDGQPLHIKVVQRSIEVENEVGQKTPALLFGAAPDGTYEPGELIPLHNSAWYSLVQAAHVVPETILQVVLVVRGLLTQTVAFKTVGGPGMLYDIAVKSAEAGWDSFLSAMAAISVNLGVMNLIPIPVLDGFHVLASAVEAIRRKPLSLRAREYANLVGLGMLLLLMVFVLKNDVVRYFLSKD